MVASTADSADVALVGEDPSRASAFISEKNGSPTLYPLSGTGHELVRLRLRELRFNSQPQVSGDEQFDGVNYLQHILEEQHTFRFPKREFLTPSWV